VIKKYVDKKGATIAKLVTIDYKKIKTDAIHYDIYNEQYNVYQHSKIPCSYKEVRYVEM